MNHDQKLLPSWGGWSQDGDCYWCSGFWVTIKKLELWWRLQQGLGVWQEPLTESEGGREGERDPGMCIPWHTYRDTCSGLSLPSALQSPLRVSNWSNQKPADNRSLGNLFWPHTAPTSLSPVTHSRARSWNLSDDKWPRIILVNSSKSNDNSNDNSIIILITTIYYRWILTMWQPL